MTYYLVVVFLRINKGARDWFLRQPEKGRVCQKGVTTKYNVLQGVNVQADLLNTGPTNNEAHTKTLDKKPFCCLFVVL